MEVSGHGPGNADVMFVGDYGHGDDLTTHYALKGHKESTLAYFCRAAGFDFNSTYRTLLIKDAPPKWENWIKGVGSKKISDITIGETYNEKVVKGSIYERTLIEEIKSVKPNLIVPLGETSFQFLSGLRGIRKFRGSILRLSPEREIEKYTKLLPALGPYPYLYKEYSLRILSQLDISKIPKWRDERPIPDDTYRIWVCRSPLALQNYINRQFQTCILKTIPEGGFLTFDIETYMNIPTCISLCFDGFESCCIPFLDKTITAMDRMYMMRIVAELLATNIPKVNQNIKYDWKTLERWGFRVSNVVGDTMLAASTLYCEFPKNLGFLTSIYTDLPYFKDEGRQYDPSKHHKDQFYLYNAKDSLSVHQIYTKQLPETIEQGTRYVYDKLIQLMPIYRRMEDRGIRRDEEVNQKLTAKYESLFRVHTNNLRRLANDDNLNPLSSQQMIKLVFETLGYYKGRGIKGSDEESLSMLVFSGTPDNCTVETGREILKEIIICRKVHKVLEILALDVYPDGRFRCEFNLAGTETGRTSASQTTDYLVKSEFTKKGKQSTYTINLGHSLQTIGKHGFKIEGIEYGKDVRGQFVPSVGYSFVEIDLSGAEARVDRVLSGNFDLSVFDNPGIHKLTGSWVFNCKPEDIKKGSMEYHIGKTVRHAGERNMGAERFFMMAQDVETGLTLTQKEARAILTAFHGNAPEIRNVYHHDIKEALERDSFLTCPNGRRRDFFNRIDNSAINEGISFLPQAIVSDQNKFSFIQTFQEAPWAFLLAEAHDAGFSEVPIGREREFVQIYRPHVEVPIDFTNGSLKRDYQLVIPCDASIGTENWEFMEDFKG